MLTLLCMDFNMPLWEVMFSLVAMAMLRKETELKWRRGGADEQRKVLFTASEATFDWKFNSTGKDSSSEEKGGAI